MRTFAATLAAVGLAVTLTACGSTVSGTSQPAELDIRKLDVGNYPTVPLNAHDDDYRPAFYKMHEVAATRLTDYVTSAYDIDPRMKYGGLATTLSAGVLPWELGPESIMVPVAKQNKMLFGFKVAGGDKSFSINGYQPWPAKPEQHKNSTTVATTVMQFPDADRAQQAAAQFYDADFGALQEVNQPATLTKYPQVKAHSQPGSPFLRTFLAHGPYVVSFLISTPSGDMSGLTSLAQQAYDTQLPMLDKLKPLTEEEVLLLPWDPDHLLTRTLNPHNYEGPYNGNDRGLFGPQGMLAFVNNREFTKKQFTAMKADKFASLEGTLVAHVPDAATAKKTVAERITLTQIKQPAEAPPNVPDSACVENQPEPRVKRFTCVVAYREYVGFVTSDQLPDTHQRAAAQYSLFANSH
ncbi:hypothetical protein [Nocardia sp. NPDC052566]|uniref:DUF7373 family lipoprotein n=1 Tax=Nocardia sp. NPDC052566 TaxID=3364330 RepID=UPI0037C59822